VVRHMPAAAFRWGGCVMLWSLFVLAGGFFVSGFCAALAWIEWKKGDVSMMVTLDGVRVDWFGSAFNYYDREVVWLQDEMGDDGWAVWLNGSGDEVVLNGERVISMDRARRMGMGV